MLVSPLRRGSGVDDYGTYKPQKSRRSSIQEVPRRSSLANLSLRLARSKKSTASSNDDAPKDAGRLGELFFSLPVEIQSSVLQYIDVQDFYALRVSSRAVLAVLQANASAITRSLLEDAGLFGDGAYIQTLYPIPSPCLNTNHLLQMLHRKKVVDKMVDTIVSYIQINIYTIRGGQDARDFGSWRLTLPQYFRIPAWTVYHYLERYRSRLIYDQGRGPLPDNTNSQQVTDFIKSTDGAYRLVNSYPAKYLVPAYQFYHFLVFHLRASSRAPTYAGTIERRLRGWHRKAADADDLNVFIILGGLDQLSRVTIMKGTYNQRLEIIGKFVDGFAGCAPASSLRSQSKTSVPRSFDHDQHHTEDEKQQNSKSKMDSVMGDLEIPVDNITERVLNSLPSLDEFFFSPWQRRILDEELISHQSELTSPFIFVQRLMAYGRSTDPTSEEQQPVREALDDENAV